MVNESNLVMTIRCETCEPLTQTEGDTRSDARFFFTRNIVLTPLLQNLELKLYCVVRQETILSNTTELILT